MQQNMFIRRLNGIFETNFSLRGGVIRQISMTLQLCADFLDGHTGFAEFLEDGFAVEAFDFLEEGT